jgi:hypothetical protein
MGKDLRPTGRELLPVKVIVHANRGYRPIRGSKPGSHVIAGSVVAVRQVDLQELPRARKRPAIPNLSESTADGRMDESERRSAGTPDTDEQELPHVILQRLMN